MSESDQPPLLGPHLRALQLAAPHPALAMTLHQAAYELPARGDTVMDVAGTCSAARQGSPSRAPGGWNNGSAGTRQQPSYPPGPEGPTRKRTFILPILWTHWGTDTSQAG
jgi:hypothetical protein